MNKLYMILWEKALAGLIGAVYYVNTNTPKWMTEMDTWVGYAGNTWYPQKQLDFIELDETVVGINTIAFTAAGEGNHQFRSLKVNLKLVV